MDDGLLEQDEACLEAHRVLACSLNDSWVQSEPVRLQQVLSHAVHTIDRGVVELFRALENVVQAEAQFVL